MNAFLLTFASKPFANGKHCIFLLDFDMFFPFYGACEWFDYLIPKQNHSHFRFMSAFLLTFASKPFANGKHCIFLLDFDMFFPFYGACEWFDYLSPSKTIRISIL
jgi:hypothetical protein